MASNLAQDLDRHQNKNLEFESFEVLKNLPSLLDKKKLKEPFFSPPNSKFLVYGRSLNKLTVLINNNGVPIITSYHPESRGLARAIQEIFQIFEIQAELQIIQPKK